MRETLLFNDFVKIESENDLVIMELTHHLNDIHLVKKILKLRLEVTREEPYLFVINAKKVKSFSKEARDFLASEPAAERVLAAAIIIDSMVTATLANFFLRVSKPMVTTKLFTDEEDAIKWLKTIK
jgi:hypothetical protein